MSVAVISCIHTPATCVYIKHTHIVFTHSSVLLQVKYFLVKVKSKTSALVCGSVCFFCWKYGLMRISRNNWIQQTKTQTFGKIQDFLIYAT